MVGDEDVNEEDLVVRKGNIQFTVTPASGTTMQQNGTDTIKVVAEFIAGATSVGATTSAEMTVTMTASQATA